MKDFLNVKPGKQQVYNSIKLELRFSLVVEAKVLAKKPGNNQFGQEVKYIVEVLKDYKVWFIKRFRKSLLKLIFPLQCQVLISS